MLEQVLVEQSALETMWHSLQLCFRWQVLQGGCSLYQRNIQSDIQGEEDELERLDQIRRHLPGLPFGAHVSADIAVVSQTQSSPAISARDIGVPPGSIEGASRVAQIMWFGFPRIGQH